MLRAWRERRKLSQRALGELIGKDQNYISFVELGRIKQPGVAVVLDLARVLRAPEDEFLETFGWYTRDGSSYAKIANDAPVAPDDPDAAFWLDVRERVTPGEYEALMALAREIMQRSA